MFSRETRPCDSKSGSHLHEKNISWLLKALILLPVPLLLSCSTLTSENRSMDRAVKTERGEKTREATPKPGDTKIVNGVEFIYEINPRFGSDPYEPQRAWFRKEKAEKTPEGTPKRGDTKIVNGVEFIYEINPRFGSDPYEPQSKWFRKDQ